ncbi:hypothetical protein CEV08_01385 [Bartonella tribocorum]|uniref:Uncharacterized protein n=1 Tax=Bartonella tribocorum TaxID=85701 RepID=A0A2M6UXM6_9HYPH|nr:hypothetical protein CEV08_01385 [Bartonella tribocorum]
MVESQVERTSIWAIYKPYWIKNLHPLKIGRKPKSNFYREKVLIRIKTYQGTLLQKFFIFKSNLLISSFVRGASLISLKLKQMLFIQVSCYNA